MPATLEKTAHLPPSASVVEIAGREYIIAPFDEFKVWERGLQGGGKSGIASLRGKGRGKVWMADDFDAPMEEFAEYM